VGQSARQYSLRAYTSWFSRTSVSYTVNLFKAYPQNISRIIMMRVDVMVEFFHLFSLVSKLGRRHVYRVQLAQTSSRLCMHPIDIVLTGYSVNTDYAGPG